MDIQDTDMLVRKFAAQGIGFKENEVLFERAFTDITSANHIGSSANIRALAKYDLIKQLRDAGLSVEQTIQTITTIIIFSQPKKIAAFAEHNIAGLLRPEGYDNDKIPDAFGVWLGGIAYALEPEKFSEIAAEQDTRNLHLALIQQEIAKELGSECNLGIAYVYRPNPTAAVKTASPAARTAAA